MAAVPFWSAREDLGRRLSTLLLDEYDLPPIEDIKKLFDNCWEKEKPRTILERLNIIISLLETIKARLLHYSQLCRLSFTSEYLKADLYLAKDGPLSFFDRLAGGYSFHRAEISYYQDLISHVILFNDVKNERLIDFCDLIEKVSNHLQDKQFRVRHMKELQRKIITCCEKVDEDCDCDYDAFESRLKAGYDVVDC